MMRHAVLLALAGSLSWALLGTSPPMRPDVGRALAPQAPAVVGFKAKDRQGLARWPIAFIENRGQLPEPVEFVARQGALTAYFLPDAFRLTLMQPSEASLERYALDTIASAWDPAHSGSETSSGASPRSGAHVFLAFEDASHDVRLEGIDELPARFHYLRGANPDAFVTDVPSYAGVRYRDLYPGIDVHVRDAGGRLEYDLLLDPGADLDAVVMHCEGIDALQLVDGGRLELTTPAGPLVLGQPATYQVLADGSHLEVACAYRLLGADRFGFTVPGRDATRALVIDPDLAYGAYLGGSFQEFGYAIAVDASGAAYVAGRANSVDFPVTPGAFQAVGGTDGFVAKVAPDGQSLVYATYLGGAAATTDDVHGIAVDPTTAVWLCGVTTSSDFPTTADALDTTLDGPADGYVVHLAPDGASLLYAAFLGGSEGDSASSVQLDVQLSAYVVGTTDSPDFPTTPGAFDEMLDGQKDNAFIAKLTPQGALTYATLLGGDASTWGVSIDVDQDGCAYVTGRVTAIVATTFPATPGAFDTTGNGEVDAYVAKLNADGSGLVYATFLGGSFFEEAWGIAVDDAGAAYVTGRTDSFGFPTTAGAFDTSKSGFFDIFVTKVAPDGASLSYSTLVGSSGFDEGWGIAVDSLGRATIAAQTSSAFFPTTTDAYDSSLNGTFDAVLVQLDPSGSSLSYSTFFGGTNDPADWGWGIALDDLGHAYLTGQTMSADFPATPGAFDETLGGFSDGWVVKFALSPWSDLGFGLAGTGGVAPELTATGSLEPGSAGSITLVGALPTSPAILVVGLEEIALPFKGGTLVPAPLLLLALVSDTEGGSTLAWTAWPAGVPTGTELFVQHWIADPAGPKGLAASNALKAVVPAP